MKHCLPFCLFFLLVLLLWQGITAPPTEASRWAMNASFKTFPSTPRLAFHANVTEEAHDIYDFSDEQHRALFLKIIDRIRCIVCVNQKLSESAAPLALDLKQAIYQQILVGRSESEVIAFVKNRYGDFALYQPPVRWNTAVLWYGPFIAALLGICIFARHIVRS